MKSEKQVEKARSPCDRRKVGVRPAACASSTTARAIIRRATGESGAIWLPDVRKQPLGKRVERQHVGSQTGPQRRIQESPDDLAAGAVSRRDPDGSARRARFEQLGLLLRKRTKQACRLSATGGAANDFQTTAHSTGPPRQFELQHSF